MNPQKEFKIASIVLIILAVLDVLMISVSYFEGGSFAASVPEESKGFIFALFVVISIITLAKFYMGIMGLRYCMGKGKGKFHITLAKIGIALAAIATVISVMDMISGTGNITTVLSDATDVYLIYWYFKLATKNYT